MMMTKWVYPSLLIAALLTAICGCRVGPARYRASATIQTRPSNTVDRGGIVIMPAELKNLQAVAASVVTGAAQVAVEHIANTELIRVSVTTADPVEAAALCNEIAERFVSAAGEGDIERQLVQIATPPRKPIR
jgi:hypothetical protein